MSVMNWLPDVGRVVIPNGSFGAWAPAAPDPLDQNAGIRFFGSACSSWFSLGVT